MWWSRGRRLRKAHINLRIRRLTVYLPVAGRQVERRDIFLQFHAVNYKIIVPTPSSVRGGDAVAF